MYLAIFICKIMQKIQLSRINMSYDIYGDSNLPPVLLIMGIGMSSKVCSRDFINLLLRKGLRVIIADNRDSGQSTHFSNAPISMSVPVAIGRAFLRLPIPAPYSLEDMALDYSEFLNKIHVDRTHIIGISLGGMIAQTLATIRPSQTSSLTIVMGSSGNPRTCFGKMKTVYSLWSYISSFDRTEEIEKSCYNIFNLLKSPNYHYNKDERQALIKEVVEAGLDIHAIERQFLAIFSSGDRSNQLKTIKAPTLILHGEDDPIVPLSAAKELVEIIPQASLNIFEKMGHDLPPIHFEKMANLIASHIWNSEG